MQPFEAYVDSTEGDVDIDRDITLYTLQKKDSDL